MPVSIACSVCTRHHGPQLRLFPFAVPRLLHTADWQIGKPFRWIDDPKRRSRLQRARLEAIERIISLGTSHSIDVVLVAGDLFDSSTVDAASVMETLELIGSCDAPVLVIPGNHDHGGAGGVWRRNDVQQEMALRAANLQLLLSPALELCGHHGAALPLAAATRERESRRMAGDPRLGQPGSAPTARGARPWLGARLQGG